MQKKSLRNKWGGSSNLSNKTSNIEVLKTAGEADIFSEDILSDASSFINKKSKHESTVGLVEKLFSNNLSEVNFDDSESILPVPNQDHSSLISEETYGIDSDTVQPQQKVSKREFIMTQARDLPFNKWSSDMHLIVKATDDDYYVSRLLESNQNRNLQLGGGSLELPPTSKSLSVPKLANNFISSASMPTFPFKEGEEQPSPEMWEKFFNEVEIYETSTTVQYDRAGLPFQKNFVEEVMCMAAERCASENDAVVLRQLWNNHEALPTAKFKAAFLSITKQEFSVTGESNFDKFAREVRNKRSLKFLEPLHTSGLIAKLRTLSEQLDLGILQKHEQLKLVLNLKESLRESLSDTNGFGPSVRSALAEIFTSEATKANPDLFFVLKQIRELQDAKVKLLVDIKQSFSPSLIRQYLLEGGKDSQSGQTKKMRIEGDSSNSGNTKKPRADVESKPFKKLKSSSDEGLKEGSLPKRIEAYFDRWGSKGLCKICGKSHTAVCEFKKLPENLSNQSQLEWHESKIGRAYYQLNYANAVKRHPEGYDPKTQGLLPGVTPKRELPGKAVLFSTAYNNELTRAICMCDISQHEREIKGVHVLLDTGAEMNVVNRKFVDDNNLNTIHINDDMFNSATNLQACGVIKGGACTPITKVARLLIKHVHKDIPPYEETFFVGDFAEDLVLSRSTCKRLNILLAYPELFFNHAPTVIPLLNGTLSANNATQVELTVGTPSECSWAKQARISSTDKCLMSDVVAGDVQPLSNKVCARDNTPALHACKVCLEQGLPVDSARFCCQSCYKTAWPDHQLLHNIHIDVLSSNLNNDKLDTATLTPAMSNYGISMDTTMLQPSFSENYSRKVYASEDIYEIPENKLEAIPSDLLYNNTPYEGDNDLPKQIFGSSELRERLTTLLKKFRHIFSRDVRSDPANLSPFKFEVNEAAWKTYKNRTARRKYDLSRQEELKKIIIKLLEAGVIKPSRAAYYSHGFVVPKATPGQWRLVIDYKNLNKVCSTERWPIPDIREILQRIGDKRPKIFNVMDMTSGYYQAPIDEQCWEYTAFMTHMGLYEWTRLPMGPTGACSFFPARSIY